jgi:predicted protein tyrosine phosphatase
MLTEICGHGSVHGLLAEDPRARDLLLVTNPGFMPFGDDANRVLAMARRVLRLEFDDFTSMPEPYFEFADFTTVPAEKVVLPAIEHVQQALEWARGSEDLIVACHAGVSRCSALAYVLRSRDWSPSQAIKLLTRGYHSPNRLIVEIGAKLLANPAVWDTYEVWRMRGRR